MKVCYVDESGNDSQDPCLVMVGIVVDAIRLNRTQHEFDEIFEMVQKLFQENLRELKGSKIIFGRDRWRNVDPDARKRVVHFFCDWLVKRKHCLAITAIDRDKFSRRNGDDFPEIANDPWIAAAVHLTLQLQKHHQSEKSNKGHTFLIFDENKKMADNLAELLYHPPAWTDQYYGRAKKQGRLDQIIDSAFTVKSHHAGLVQVADLYAFIFRRYAELNEYGSTQMWHGEKDMIDGYVSTLATRMLPRSCRWVGKSSVPCQKWWSDVAPNSLLALGKTI
ncbi:MAG: DUF3800 domain-containing protein [Planctomycetia bacterium]|nr:DUF3800 domain-containing protein [Planctomycetia bacterium]